jgi:DNA-nicking Smr family endonuclease
MPRAAAAGLACAGGLAYARRMAKRRDAPVPAVAPEDAELFRAAIGPVRELAPPPDAPRAPKPAPEPRQREADEADALRQSQAHPFELADVAAGDALEYLRDGLSPKLLRQLRRGQFSIEDEIDLHGMNSALAENVVRTFLRQCRDAGHHCVRIVHGKGLRSGDEGPVLKARVEQWLRLRADVLAFASAPPAQGGTGAVLVLLARRRPG